MQNVVAKIIEGSGQKVDHYKKIDWSLIALVSLCAILFFALMCFPGCGQGDKSEADPDTYGFKLIPFCGSVSITYLVNDTEEVTITCEAPNVIQREFFLVDKFCAKWNGDGICRFYRGNEPLLTVYKDETGGELRWPVEVVE